MKEIINLEDYGELLSIEEYIVDREDNNIVGFRYYNSNIESENIEGIFEIYTESNKIEIKENEESEETREILEYTHNFRYRLRTEPETPVEKTYKDLEIHNIISAIGFLEFVIKNEPAPVLPAKPFRYDNAVSKTEDEFNIGIMLGDKEISVGPFKKTQSGIIDGRVMRVIDEEDPNTMIFYIFNDNGFREEYYDRELDKATKFSNIVFNDNDVITSIFTDIDSGEGVISKIHNLREIPKSFIYNGEKIEIEYDKYGLPLSDSGITLYEYNGSEDEADLISSIHPLYYDNFDPSLSYDGKLCCLDQLDFNTDEKYVTYTRVIVNVAEDKLDELHEDLRYGEEESDHPMIDLYIED